MSSSWKSLRNLFWQSAEPETGSGAGDSELSDEEFAALLSNSPHGIPPHGGSGTDSVDLNTVQVQHSGDKLSIDFQAQYDAAGIPDTDEVEKLEAFLTRLDPSLPAASKVAAAEAFLGAIGRARADVLVDAERKINRVRSVVQSKLQDTDAILRAEQTEIDALQLKIEEHKGRILHATKELEAFRHACIVEESRLQGVRVFFGNSGQPATLGGSKANET